MFFLLLLVLMTITNQKQQCQLPQVFMNRIQHDLKPFEGGITSEMIIIAKQLKQACIFTIKNAKLYKSQNCILQSYFDCQEGPLDLPDMQFVVSWLDEPRILKHSCNKSQVHWTDDCYCDKEFVKPPHGFFQNPVFWMPTYQKIPLFGSATIKECFLDILIPSAYHFSQDVMVAPHIPWNKKLFKIFWRGSPTGGSNQQEHSFRKYHRHKLLQLCWNIPDCDANFSHYLHNKPSHLLTEQVYGQQEHTPMRRQAIYKIIIDIDGHTYSSRFTNLLRMGVAVMKIASFDDIGSIAATPWKHYIPVDISLKDFQEKIKWAKQNDEEVQKISIRGKEMADSFFTSQNYYCYLTTLLQKYHKLLIKGGAIS